MKIFTIAATPFFSDRGCHIRIYNEAKYLQGLGAQVQIATYHLGKDVPGLEIKRIGNVSWYKKISPGFAWGKPWLDLKLLLLCIKQIKTYQPDIIHAHLYEALAIARLAKMFSSSQAKIVFDLQGDLQKEMASYNKRNRMAREIFSYLAKKIIRYADVVVLSSDRVLENIRPVYQGEIEVVQDGVDLQLYRAGKNSENKLVKKILDWKKDSQLLIYTGSMDDSKGVGDLIDEFIEVSSQFPAWKLLLAGHGRDLEKYRLVVKERNIEHGILLVGGTSYFELPQYLSVANLAIDPKTGTTEASGKLVNYMAAQLPIVCYENDFNKGFLKDDGIYISDINQLGKAIEQYEKRSTHTIDYDLGQLDEKVYAQKLHAIMNAQTK